MVHLSAHGFIYYKIHLLKRLSLQVLAKLTVFGVSDLINRKKFVKVKTRATFCYGHNLINFPNKFTDHDFFKEI